MSTHSDLQLIQHITRELDENRPARLAYTQAAFDNDIIDGVEVFDKNAEQNIPKADMTDYNPSVLDDGIRSQGGSIPRMGWNHYIGRLSFNLAKIVQKIKDFLELHAAWMAHNAAEYDHYARYKTGDVCYTVSVTRGVKVYTWYIRHSMYPKTIANIPPNIGSHWEEMQSATSSSALLPFSAPGYRHKYAVADLTHDRFDRDTYYPVVTGAGDFANAILDGTDDAVQVAIEAYCSGTVAGAANPHRADLVVLASFTGAAASSTDIVLRNSFTDMVTGADKDPAGSPIGYGKLPAGKQAVLWLRGGGTYALWNSYGSNFELQESVYDNGFDEPVEPGEKVFSIAAGTVCAKLRTPDAVLPSEAPNLGQLAGALPLPRALDYGGQLDAIRTPGTYTATGAAIANSIGQLPVDDPGPFVLVVTGDKKGAETTIQRLVIRASGDEWTRTLSGNVVIVPWYRSSSPEGTAVFVPGLYRFEVDEQGHLLLYYQTEANPPRFWIAETGHLTVEILDEGETA
jgi:hypothetical protein